MSAEQMCGRDNAIVLAGGAAALVLAALCLALAGSGQQGTVIGLRATAVLALPLLVGAYVAPALAVLWPGRFSEWLFARRRSFGLAFSAVFSVHLVLIVRFLSLPPSPPHVGHKSQSQSERRRMLLAGMVLPSFSRIARVLGVARVRLLRRVGEQWVFAVFTLTLINGASKNSALWLVPLTIVMASYAMRFKAWRRSSRP